MISSPKLFGLMLLSFGFFLGAHPAQALPPAEDIPEEVLRSQVILDARSPVDGKPLTPAEYAELQAKLQSSGSPLAQLSPRVKEVVFLLNLRRLFKTLAPF